MTAFVQRTGIFSDFLIEADPEPERPSEPPRPDRCLFLSGLVVLDGELVTDASRLTELVRRKGLSPARLAELPGQFVVVLRSGGRTFVCNDLLGLEHIYLLDRSPQAGGLGHPVVSNRLAALVQLMKSRGIERRLRPGAVAAGLCSPRAFFRQLHSHDLPIEGVSLVPVDRFVEIAGGRVILHPKPVLERALYRSGTEPYEELVDRGVAEIVSTLRAVVESPRFATPVVTLSGGYDSRITFAGALRAGLLDRLPVITRNVPGSDDLPIAARIVQLAGGHYFSGDDRPNHAVSPELKLTLWRSFFSGLYHVMNDRCRFRLGGGRPLARLTGGGGEVYSTFWLGAFERFLSDGRDGTAERVFRRLRDVDDLPEPLFEAARESFVRAVESLPGDSLAERLENHYLYFRNRVHFGQKGWQAFAGVLPISPLVSAPLLEASRRRSIEERSRQLLTFELTSRLAPMLAFVEYNGGARWPRELLRRIPDHHGLERRAQTADGEAKGAERRAAMERWHARLDALGSPREELAPTPTLEAFYRVLGREVRASVERIREEEPELGRILERSEERWAASTPPEKPGVALAFASKVFGIHDACFDDDRRSLVVEALPAREEYADNPLRGVVRVRSDEGAPASPAGASNPPGTS